jgi:hypothetical protein
MNMPSATLDVLTAPAEYLGLQGRCCIFLDCLILNRKALRFVETPINVYQTIRRNMPEDLNLQNAFSLYYVYFVTCYNSG